MPFKLKSEPIEFKHALGILVSIRRQERGLTQEELSQEMAFRGMSQTMISRIEAGRAKLKVEDLRELCVALGVEVGRFLGETDNILRESVIYGLEGAAQRQIEFSVNEKLKAEKGKK